MVKFTLLKLMFFKMMFMLPVSAVFRTLSIENRVF